MQASACWWVWVWVWVWVPAHLVPTCYQPSLPASVRVTTMMMMMMMQGDGGLGGMGHVPRLGHSFDGLVVGE